MKHTTKEDVKYYKSMTLTSNNLVISVKESTVEEPASISIFHSPSRFEQDKFRIRLKDRKELQDYIDMLVDFSERFGELLDNVQKKEVK